MEGEFNFPRPTVKIGDCIAVVGHKTKKPKTKGHVSVCIGGEQWKGSRLSYSLNVESIPRTPESLKEGLVLHRCDNGWCVNPDHLYIGSAEQNTKDYLERNKEFRSRMSRSARRAWKDPSRREKQSNSLLGNSNAKGKTWTWRCRRAEA